MRIIKNGFEVIGSTSAEAKLMSKTEGKAAREKRKQERDKK